MLDQSKISNEDLKLLSEYYINRKMSINQISENSQNIFNCYLNSSSIYKLLIRNNINLRSKSEGISLATSTLDKNISFESEEMTEWVDGFLLGDGGISFDRKYAKENKKCLYARYFMGSVHAEWTNFAMSKFKVYNAKEASTNNFIDKKHPNPMWISRTVGHPDIAKQVDRWYPYPERIKRVPNDVRITPISALLWYLGDGTLNSNKSVCLATCSFTEDEINNILIPIFENYEIHCSIRWWKHYPYLNILRNSGGKFFDFIGTKSPISCYDYKFDLKNWYRYLRISDIAKNKTEIFRARDLCQTNRVEYTREEGNKFFVFTDEQANKLRQMLDETGFKNIGNKTIMTNYISKHSVMGMLSANYFPLTNYAGYVKNRKEVVLFDKNLIPNYLNMEKINLSYLRDKDISINGYKVSSKYNMTVLVSKFNKEFFDLKGKNFREIRETKNHYDKKVVIKNSIENIDEIIEFISKWIDIRGDDKYGWRCHAGYDKNFFTKYYMQEKDNLWSNFFYIDDKLVGYSIISKEACKLQKFNYIIRKSNTTYRNLCLYIDFKSFQRIFNDGNEEFYINWGANDSTLLKYKKKFPVYVEEKAYFMKFVKVKEEQNKEIENKQEKQEEKMNEITKM